MKFDEWIQKISCLNLNFGSLSFFEQGNWILIKNDKDWDESLQKHIVNKLDLFKVKVEPLSIITISSISKDLYSILSMDGMTPKLSLTNFLIELGPYFYSLQKRSIIPKTESKNEKLYLQDYPLLKLSGVQLALLIKSRRVSCTKIVQDHIEYSKKVNVKLNAVVKDRYELALIEARRVDQIVKDTKDLNTLFSQKPYLGVPCYIKENFKVIGMPNTSGLHNRVGIIPNDDAETVKYMKEAGFIILGVTNTSEACMWMESFNTVYGVTNNPYNQKCTAGGSSGGSGSICGAGACPIALGSDVGGSVRGPAFYNGVFGHKPSSLLVPNGGQYPEALGESRKYLCTGPLTRKAEDLYPMMQVFTKGRIQDPDNVDLRKIKVISIEDVKVPLFNVSKDLIDSQRSIVKHLESLGCTIIRDITTFENLDSSVEIWSSMLQTGNITSHWENIGKPNTFQELMNLIREGSSGSKHTLPSLLLVYIEYINSFFPERAKYYVEMGKKLQANLVKTISHDTIILFPNYLSVAPEHYLAMMYPVGFIAWGIWNTMEFPATNVPMGLNKDNLPLGVQVISNRGNDHICIRIAQELEKKFGGWVEPKL